MSSSPEYPQYRWMPPRSYTPASRRWMDPIHLIVIHTTEGSEGPSSAEDGAAYDQRRTDGTSAHFYVDSTSVVHCVRTDDKAHTAKAEGNTRGIHIEVCGRAGQSAAQWDDPVSRATVEQLAGLCRVLLADYPAPVKRLSVSEVRAGKPGFCGHAEISEAFGQSDHWDPGPNFPWGRLFSLIEEGDVGTVDGFSEAGAEQFKAVYNAALHAAWLGNSGPTEAAAIQSVHQAQSVVLDKLDAILAAVLQVDEETVAKLTAAQMTPQEVAAVLRQLPGVTGREAAIGAALAAAV